MAINPNLLLLSLSLSFHLFWAWHMALSLFLILLPNLSFLFPLYLHSWPALFELFPTFSRQHAIHRRIPGHRNPSTRDPCQRRVATTAAEGSWLQTWGGCPLSFSVIWSLDHQDLITNWLGSSSSSRPCLDRQLVCRFPLTPQGESELLIADLDNQWWFEK